ncbi:sigma-54-dependent Fis family transcriptional regulator [Nitrospirillum iridis]|uniref:Transcriptional regulator of acetoin/glycerol metabolism n=1 Tax=Nitrospirillum iridis TaxID=765888 RepID=A0A7X0EBN1_9PROT|nr:sigma-54-dependent Fis family transcriptional regulator [Nitrospirillum iridis]MBB6250857.1 transcriptional regulator of acetoin/glycerol metabolism [Nitrospirillum iridis]
MVNAPVPAAVLASARERLMDPGGLSPTLDPGGLWPTLDDAPIPPVIVRSWRRCADRGLRADRPAHQDPLSRADLAALRERHNTLMRLATPELDTLHQAMRDLGGMVLLTNDRGLILDARGEGGFVRRARRVSLQPGAGWGEDDEGTNAVGTALAERTLIQVRGPEHYLTDNAFLICTAMPVMDPYGTLAGVIDLSGDMRQWPSTTQGPDARALASLAVAHLEHRWAVQAAAGHELLVRLHAHPGWLGTPQEGLLAVDGGVIRAASPAALAMLGLGAEAIGDTRLDEVLDGALAPGEGVLRPRDGGRPLHARVTAPARGRPLKRPPVRRPARTPTPAAAPQTMGRDGILWDATTRPLLDRAILALNAGIPILLQGETGTGKEVFVRAAHAAGARAQAPLVAVNCAAIPEGLLESELFGYEDGAFTGARRGGHRGQIRQADGGLLFLDEIGDMPPALQARLLRVLQDGEVTPVGGRPVKVDFRLVAATHRDLAAAVAAGTFRADLYYRLKHLVVTLPPLRQRPLDSIIDALMTTFGAGDRGIRLAPAARDRLRRHDWPGNLRELANLLRTLVALSPTGTLIAPADLPAELEEPLAGTAVLGGGEGQAVHPTSSLKAREEDAIRQALARHRGNVSAAARELGVHRCTLHRRLAEQARSL